jgi:hypothetical protein
MLATLSGLLDRLLLAFLGFGLLWPSKCTEREGFM